MSRRDTASNPLTERYASKEMSYLFSSDWKFRTWRKLWIALAEAERELGLPVAEHQIAELRQFADDINYDVAEAREREVRHVPIVRHGAWATPARAWRRVRSPDPAWRRDGSP